jgi:Cu-Zn family superoxide dismutase
MYSMVERPVSYIQVTIMNKKQLIKYTLLISLIFAFSSVALIAASMAETGSRQRAIAVLHPTVGNQTIGDVNFLQTAEGIRVTADINGLSHGAHGFHIHQWGDCSAEDGTSAGGHYNPAGNSHGGPLEKVRHVGDLGNIEVGPDGKGHYDRVDVVISLDGPDSIVGRAVIVHAGTDDMHSQPTGAAGGRIACGVIGWAK